jgi:hypothetical protein
LVGHWIWKIPGLGTSRITYKGNKWVTENQCWIKNYSNIKDKMKDKVDSIFIMVLYMLLEGVFIEPQSSCFTQNNVPDSNVYNPSQLQGRSGHFLLPSLHFSAFSRQFS